MVKGSVSGWSWRPIDAGKPTSVSCASSSFCAAVTSNGNALTYSGSSWSGPAEVGDLADLTSVSCPSPSFCAAVAWNGQDAVTLTYNGSTWSAPAQIDGEGELNSVS